jgi:hypothetical protein
MAITQMHLAGKKEPEISFMNLSRMVRVREDLLIIAKMIRLVMTADDPRAKVEEIIEDLSQPVEAMNGHERGWYYRETTPLIDEDAEWLREELRKWLGICVRRR